MREIWPHEALDFTRWLAKEKNLKLLIDSICIGIVLEETESSVGNFNVDMYATEVGTGRNIILKTSYKILIVTIWGNLLHTLLEKVQKLLCG